MEEFWASSEVAAWKKRLAEDPDLDPIESLIEAIIASAWPPPVAKRSLDIKKAKETSARVQDLPEAPAQNAPLLSSVVEAKRILAERMAIVREDKKKLQEQCKEAEARIIPELAELPEGYIRRVNLRDPNGAGEESFYLRLKPPRKKPPKKFSTKKVGLAMKTLLQERLETSSRQELIDRLGSPRFGTTACRDLAELLTGPADAESTCPRVALDRLREGAAASAGGD